MPEESKRKINGRIKLGGLLVVLFLLLYIPSFIFWIYGKNIHTDIIRMGALEDYVTTDAYIVRDETVINSPSDGISIRNVEEGEKVGAADTIATILNKSSEKLLEDLKTLDLRIIQAKREKTKNDNFFSEDIKKLDQEIQRKLLLIIKQSNRNSISEAKQIKNDIDELIKKKATISGDLSYTDATIKALENEKKILQESINASKRNIVSNSSGIVSYVIDGYEGILNSEKIPEITPEMLGMIKAVENNGMANDLNTQYNKPFVKVIGGLDYYIVFAMAKEEADDFKVDDYLNIRINDIGRVVDGTIAYKSNEIDGKFVIAVRTDKALSDTASLRVINVDLIKSRYEGLIVPVKSLVNIDTDRMQAKIALVRARRANFVPVKIVGRNNNFAVIDNIEDYKDGGVSLYSSYIINPKNIEEGQVIN
ncbi:HlyD family efflux transporter periplasmic adaptor subunit [Acetivibrio straminisolvens]|uniref:Chromosome partition protein smc n=1 Tax=Acetivibrio straminisolvens JCM 21531 TaxID=1294263 RepID=W4V4N2_9FIRM|nr:HlyD family efflux transporter periplasmic adaptor subunit [Acetivibrio straminisolvens]GAE87714.1 chromosome partition protein smc [Acetivibrio straminisolvens JCM 21531]